MAADSPVSATPQAPPGDAYDGLPSSWSASAREVYVQVEADHPDLGPSALAALFEACHLIGLADAMEARVAEDGLMIPGSQGQLVPHGLLSEIRLCRTQAMAGLKALGIAPGQSPASAAGAALAMRRHHGRTTGRRAVQ